MRHSTRARPALHTCYAIRLPARRESRGRNPPPPSAPLLREFSNCFCIFSWSFTARIPRPLSPYSLLGPHINSCVCGPAVRRLRRESGGLSYERVFDCLCIFSWSRTARIPRPQPAPSLGLRQGLRGGGGCRGRRPQLKCPVSGIRVGSRIASRRGT